MNISGPAFGCDPKDGLAARGAAPVGAALTPRDLRSQGFLAVARSLSNPAPGGPLGGLLASLVVSVAADICERRRDSLRASREACSRVRKEPRDTASQCWISSCSCRLRCICAHRALASASVAMNLFGASPLVCPAPGTVALAGMASGLSPAPTSCEPALVSAPVVIAPPGITSNEEAV